MEIHLLNSFSFHFYMKYCIHLSLEKFVSWKLYYLTIRFFIGLYKEGYTDFKNCCTGCTSLTDAKNQRFTQSKK